METIQTLFQHCTSRFATLYIVIDSLDEFDREERSFIFRWCHPNVDSWPTIYNYCDQEEHYFDGDDHSISTLSEA